MEKMTDVEIVKAAKSAHEHLSGLKDMHKALWGKDGHNPRRFYEPSQHRQVRKVHQGP